MVRVRWAALLAALTLLAACGGGSSGNETGGGGETPAAEGGEGIRVALLTPGTENNRSWANAWWDGIEPAVEELGGEAQFVGPLDTPEQYVQQGSAFASQGFDFLMFANGGMRDAAIQVAEQFPDVLVCQFPYHPADDAELEELPENMCVVDMEQQDATFLAGMLAGLVTETGQVASVNGFPFPALTRQPESFSLGARCVNPDVTFNQQYIESWDDTGLAKAAAQQLIAGGADVILAATDQAFLGVVEAAREADNQVWVIPSYFDTYEEAPEVILTSAIHGLTEIGGELVQQAAAGEIEGQSFLNFDVTTTETIQTAPLYDHESELGEDVVAQFEGLVEAARAGDIEIPDETVGDAPIGTEGAAEEIDPASLGCEVGS